MNVAFRWSLLAVCGSTLLSAPAWSQAGPPPADTPPAEAPPPPVDAPPPPPPPPPPVVEAPMAPPPAPPPPAAEAYVPPAQPAFKIETPNKSTLKVGLLLQPQFQASQPRFGAPAAPLDGFGYNLYIRRTRILLGGSLFGGVLEYFLDTDFPTCFWRQNTTDAMGMVTGATKNTPGMNIQDAFITYKPMGDLVQDRRRLHAAAARAQRRAGRDHALRVGLLRYTFRSGNLFSSSGNPIGRDAGLQLRGLVARRPPRVPPRPVPGHPPGADRDRRRPPGTCSASPAACR